MGAIRGFLTGLDRANDVQKEQAALIEALAALAESKVETFKAELYNNLIGAGAISNMNIPVTDILDFTSETHAYAPDQKNQDVLDSIGKSLKGFVPGGSDNSINGVTTLLGHTVIAFFEDGSRSEDALEKYYVLMEGASFVRLDVFGWRRQVTGTAMATKIQQVSAFVACKSAIDFSKLKFDTFLEVYSPVLTAGNPKMTPEELQAEVAQAKALFNQFQ